MTTQTAEPRVPAEVIQSPRSTRMYWYLLLLAWVASALYMSTHLLRGWVPHDEGAFAQSAERVLQGQLPHRDFLELYTGGLSFVHALAFRVMGANLATLRYVLFGAFLAWIPAVYYVATRFGSPLAAGGVTLLCVAWSVPNYAAAVPSWYNLFLATFAVAAVLRYLETRAPRWMFFAGLCGGFSFVVKSVGLYLLAGIWMFLLFREQSLNQADGENTKERSSLFRAMAFSSVLFLVVLLILLIRQRSGAEEVVHFVFPTASLGFLLLFREWRGIRVNDAKRFSMLAEMAGPFLAGAALPILAYLIPYIRGHAVTAVIRGVFILPARRIAGASMSPPELLSLLAVVPIAALLAMAALSGRRFRLILTTATALALAGVWYLSAREEYVYQAVWYSAANLIPVLILAGVAVLTVSPAICRTSPGLRQQQLMLLLSALSLCSVVQFPFSAAIYFCYVAPLVALTVFALLSLFPQLSKRLLVCVLAFYLFFAVTRITPGFIYAMEESYKPDVQTAPLHLDRAGGLRVTAEEAVRYQQLIAAVREHTRGPFIYAAPDCPEVYFLAGFHNPTRSLFDFLDDSSGREEILNALELHQVNVIVIYDKPAFSSELPDTLREALEDRFPSSRNVGPFEVRWRP